MYCTKYVILTFSFAVYLLGYTFCTFWVISGDGPFLTLKNPENTKFWKMLYFNITSDDHSFKKQTKLGAYKHGGLLTTAVHSDYLNAYHFWFSCNRKMNFSLLIFNHGFGVDRPCIPIVSVLTQSQPQS